MLDIVYVYSNKWRYQFNTTKSVVMVFGESQKSRLQARESRCWRLGDQQLREVDEYHHLGILKTVSISTIARTNERVSSARSAFYALQSVGSRFGSLHPLTSLQLYRSLCLPILLYGSEVWTFTKTELLMLERFHRKILRTVQGLPTRCPSLALLQLLGVQPISHLIAQRSLSFVVSTLNLPDNAVAKRVLLVRISDSATKSGLISRYQLLFHTYDLPALSSIIHKPPMPAAWKVFLKKHFAIREHLDFLAACDHLPLSDCQALKLLKPAPHWSITRGDVNLTRMNIFRIRLLVGCDGLEGDAARFRSRTNSALCPQDPSCKLCGASCEDALHFVSCCPILDSARLSLLSSAPPPVASLLPDPSLNPRDFCDVLLGVNWIDSALLQRFCIVFLQHLRDARDSLLSIS